MEIRRVTTGKDSGGRSVFIEDVQVPPVTVGFLPGVEFFLLGGGDAPPAVGPGAGAPFAPGFFPGPGGFRVTVSTIPPTSTVGAPADIDKRVAIAELNEKLPGLLSASEREPGMHTSHTLDYVWIVEGEVDLELDDGARVQLGPGDLVTQMGARHRWSNRGLTTAVMLSVIIGAEGVPPTR